MWWALALPSDFSNMSGFFSVGRQLGFRADMRLFLQMGRETVGAQLGRQELGSACGCFGKVTLHPRFLSASLQSSDKNIKQPELLLKDRYSS